MRSYLAELIKKIRHYRLDEKTPSQTKTKIDWKQVLLLVEYNMLSETMAKGYLHTIETDIKFFKDFPEFLHELPEPEQLYAEGRPHIRLGSLADDRNLEFGLRFDLPLFVVLSGLTGFGKTTAVRVLLKRIHEYNLLNPEKKIVVIVFDRKGGDYADLPALFGWKHYHIYNSLRLSLENPRGMSPQVWINILASLFCARAGLKYSWVTIASALRTLLALLNPKPAQRLIWPDFQLLLDFLRALPETEFSTKAEYTRSLKQQLTGFTQSTFKTFNAFQGFRVEELIAAGQSVVIAMPNMDPAWARQLSTDIVISSVSKGRIERSERVDRTQVIFVADEAGPDVNEHVELLFSDQMCPYSELFKRGREFGLGGCISVSSLRTVSPFIRENATTHLTFRPSDARARAEAAATIMLPPYGELTLDHLGIGQCLVKQIGPWPHAMKGQIDYMPPSRVHVTKYDTHAYIPSKQLWQIPAVQQFVDDRNEARRAAQKPKVDKQTELYELAMKVLSIRGKNPYAPLAPVFKVLGVRHHKAQIAIRKFIEDRGYGEFEVSRLGRSDRLLMDITPEGHKALGLPVPQENKGRGGITHRHCAQWIKLAFQKKGLEAFLEFQIPGTTHPADVAVLLDDKWHLFEVCITAKDNLSSHIEACFEKSTEAIESLTVVAATKIMLEQMERELRSSTMSLQYAGRIRFEVVENYIIKELKNEDN